MPISIQEVRASFSKGEEVLTKSQTPFRIEAVEEKQIVLRPRRGTRSLPLAWKKVGIVINHFREIENSHNLEHAINSVLARFGESDSQKEPYLYGLAKKFWATRRKSKFGAPTRSPSGQDYLVLWKYSEALRVEGHVIKDAFGTHAGSLRKGDRMFVAATRMDELYLLGAIAIERTGKKSAVGRNLSGAFQILPLKALKWKLRFASSNSPQLSKEYKLARQVRSRRELTQESALLLEALLSNGKTRRRERFVAEEGKVIEFTLQKHERDPKVRANALVERGTVCEICCFDFSVTYGEFATNCVEVHHMKLLSKAPKSGTTTLVEDVIVVCPNCHRALHRYKQPGDWKEFKKSCALG